MFGQKIRSLWNHLSTEAMAGTGSLGAFWDRQNLTLVRIQRLLTSVEVTQVSHFTLPEEGLTGLVPEIREILWLWGLPEAPIGLAVSPHLGFMRQVTLPRAARENVAKVMSYEMDRFLPLSAEQLCYDFQIVKETESDLTLTLMAFPKNLTEDWLNLCAATGLKPLSIELAPTAVANAFALLKGINPANWVLLQTGERDFDVISIENNTVSQWYSKRVPAGKKFLAALRQELNRLFQAGIHPAAFFIYGPRSSEIRIGLMEYLSFPVARDSELTIRGLELEPANAPRILPAMGAAWRGVGAVPLQTNLLPESDRTAVKLTGQSLNRVLLILLVCSAGIWAGSTLVHPKISLMKVESQLAHLRPEVEQIEKKLSEAQTLGKQLQDIQNKVGQYPSALVVLKELTQMIPPHTHLYSLRARKGSIELNGKSASAADLIGILEKSGYFTKTEFISPIVTDDTGGEVFKIKAEIKGEGLSPRRAAPGPSRTPGARKRGPERRR